MNVILRRRKLGFTSCKYIKENLVERFSKEDTIIVRNYRIGNRRWNYPGSANVLFRWGCTSDFPNEVCVNNSEHIHNVNDKIRFRRLCQEGEDISIPKTFYSKSEVRDNDGEFNFPLIGRRKYHHQGRHMKVINNLYDLDSDYSSEYWSEYIPKDREFRYYVFFGRLIAVVEKIPANPSDIAWNRFQGENIFHNVRWNDWDLKCGREALKVQQAVKLDFGGIDIMLKDRQPYVLEMNSAPTLTTEYRQLVFSRGFNWVINEVENTGSKPSHYELPAPHSIESYRGLIHPCLEEE